MGFLGELKHKADEFGDKAKHGVEAAREKATDLAGDVKDKATDLAGDVKEKATDLIGDVRGHGHAGGPTEPVSPDAYDEVLDAAQHRTPEPPPSTPTA